MYQEPFVCSVFCHVVMDADYRFDDRGCQFVFYPRSLWVVEVVCSLGSCTK